VIPPNLVANFLRYGLYRIAGKSQKAYYQSHAPVT
jgi:hypothetical protein